MTPQARKMAGRPVDYQKQIDYLIDHPREFYNNWIASVGIFDSMPGCTSGSDCGCPTIVKDMGVEHPLHAEIRDDPLIETPTPEFLQRYYKMPAAEQWEILNRFRYYQEKNRELSELPV